MNSIRFLFVFAVLLSYADHTTQAAHPFTPGTPQKSPIAIVGATIHSMTGAPIVKGSILFDKGRIIAVGKTVKLPPGTRKIDGSGKHVYPGMFDALTNMGLIEINSIRATVDDKETGQINPNVRAEVAVNPDSEIIPTTRSNGVLLTLTSPSGGLVSGRSAIIQLDGWTWEDMLLKSNVGMHVQWPNMAPVSDWWEEKSAKEQIKQRDESLRRLERLIQDVRAYATARKANRQQPRDLRWESMLPVIAGDLPLIVTADDVQQIQAAVAFAQRHQLKIIIRGGYDAEQCAALLRRHKIPVIIGGTYRLPKRRGDAYDAAYTLPERLRKAGVEYCISSGGLFGASNVRNLPYHAATAVAYGLPEAEALRAITLFPAQILGVDKQVGSLEPGKHATLFVANGNPLLTETQVEAAFIQGRAVDLRDRHKMLYQKYQTKYRR